MPAHDLNDLAALAMFAALAALVADLIDHDRRMRFHRRALNALLNGDVRRYRDACHALGDMLAAARQATELAEPILLCDEPPPPPQHIHGSRLVVMHDWSTAA